MLTWNVVGDAEGHGKRAAEARVLSAEQMFMVRGRTAGIQSAQGAHKAWRKAPGMWWSALF